jgi:hypothetical protein
MAQFLKFCHCSKNCECNSILLFAIPCVVIAADAKIVDRRILCNYATLFATCVEDSGADPDQHTGSNP